MLALAWARGLGRDFGVLANGRQLLSSVYGLPFLPVSDVVDAWGELRAAVYALRPNPEVSRYTLYFESNLIFNPSYPVAMWNVSSAVVYEEPRTNNVSEGNNNGMAQAIGVHPPFFKFLDLLLLG